MTPCQQATRPHQHVGKCNDGCNKLALRIKIPSRNKRRPFWVIVHDDGSVCTRDTQPTNTKEITL